MRILGIETSGELGSVALSDGAELLAELTFVATLKHGERLFPAIENVLEIADLDRAELDLIGVAIGPGSFTGLRIGVSSAKGLAQALDIPIVGVPSSEGFQARVMRSDCDSWVVIPDRKSWVYAMLFRGKEVRREIEVYEIGDFIDLAKSQVDSEARALVVGPAAELHRNLFEAEGLNVADDAYNRPSGFEIARLAVSAHQNEKIHGLYELEPIYLQPPVTSKSKN